MLTTELSLRDRYESFKNENPKVRIRDAAKQLGVSEAELVATGLGNTVTRLTGDFRDLLKDVSTLGQVMALTRNDSCVHERHGVYEKVSFKDLTGLVLGEDIDLRLFMQQWQFGFAVNENDRLSLQFFARNGEAVHKIYMTEHSNLEAYNQLIDKYRDVEQSDILEISSKPEPAAELPDADIDIEGFQQAWIAMTDTHQFFGLLKKYQVSRTQGLRLAPKGYTRLISLESLRSIFQSASESNLPIMIFVASQGCIQIHTGTIERLMPSGPWFNVLDPMFNMHLREDHIHQIWVTRKPTEDGIVTGLELFDKDGNNIALIFGKRKPGIPEKTEWTQLVESFQA